MPLHRRDSRLRRVSGGANSTNVVEAGAQDFRRRQNQKQTQRNAEIFIGVRSA